MWMVVGAKPARLCDIQNLVERGGECVVVAVAGAVVALRAAADDQMLGAERLRGIGRLPYARQFFLENFGKDEVAAAIDRDEGQAGRVEKLRICAVVVAFTVNHVAVEELDPCIPRSGDVTRCPRHIAKGPVCETRDRRDADGVAA